MLLLDLCAMFVYFIGMIVPYQAAPHEAASGERHTFIESGCAARTMS